MAELLALQAGEARVLGADGTARGVPVEAVRAGDRVLVASGERLALDGVLLGGGALLDTSATTGESLPRAVAAGEAVPAAAVNMGAPVTVRVTRPERDG